ncbi:MAG: hypothetical protein GWP10_05935 [Nitrospiraceae bacterium]|nr:hypothetical protein [Nitrospiraceae bacterium]
MMRGAKHVPSVEISSRMDRDHNAAINIKNRIPTDCGKFKPVGMVA